jgi:hypothetical protein
MNDPPRAERLRTNQYRHWAGSTSKYEVRIYKLIFSAHGYSVKKMPNSTGVIFLIALCEGRFFGGHWKDHTLVHCWFEHM